MEIKVGILKIEQWIMNDKAAWPQLRGSIDSISLDSWIKL